MQVRFVFLYHSDPHSQQYSPLYTTQVGNSFRQLFAVDDVLKVSSHFVFRLESK